MRQLIEELESTVGERTQRERAQLEALPTEVLVLLNKYAKLAAFYKGKQLYNEQKAIKPLVPENVEEQVEKPAPKPRRK